MEVRLRINMDPSSIIGTAELTLDPDTKPAAYATDRIMEYNLAFAMAFLLGSYTPISAAHIVDRSSNGAVFTLLDSSISLSQVSNLE